MGNQATWSESTSARTVFFYRALYLGKTRWYLLLIAKVCHFVLCYVLYLYILIDLLLYISVHISPLWFVPVRFDPFFGDLIYRYMCVFFSSFSGSLSRAIHIGFLDRFGWQLISMCFFASWSKASTYGIICSSFFFTSYFGCVHRWRTWNVSII